MALTKAAFLAEYERLHLEATDDVERAEKWLEGVRATLGRAADYSVWNVAADRHAMAAWLNLGGDKKAKLSVPLLRKLPEGDEGMQCTPTS